MRYLSSSLATLLCAMCVLPAQTDEKKGEGSPPAKKPAVSVPDALKIAADILVQHQENYVVDRGLGRVPGDQLKDRQDRERERLGNLGYRR